MPTITTRQLILIAVTILLAVLLAAWYIAARQAALLSVTDDIIFEQQQRLATLASDVTNSAVQTDFVEIYDCEREDRARFDSLLSNLSTLSRTEITELNQLFGGCAFYFSTIQTVKAAHFSREIEVYKNHLRAAAVFDETYEDTLATIPDWTALAQDVAEQSRLVSELVVVQSDIINALLNGLTVQSEQVQLLIAAAQEIRQNIIFLEQQVSEQRTKLIGA